MRGTDLLLAHLHLLPGGASAPERASARERLEAEVGPELAARLLECLVPGPPRSPDGQTQQG